MTKKQDEDNQDDESLRELEGEVDKLIDEEAADAEELTKDQVKSVKKKLSKADSEAERLIDDPEEAEKVLDKAIKKLGKNKLIAGIIDDLRALIRMVRAYVRGEYREIPVATVIIAMGAIVYFVMPIDAIPDFIPIAGYVDDSVVFAAVLLAIRADLEEFRDWEKAQEKAS